MNKRGQVFFYVLMIVVVLLILAMALAPAMKVVVDNVRGANTSTSEALNCATASTDWQKANCIATDLMMPTFIGFMIFAAGIVAGAKILGAI